MLALMVRTSTSHLSVLALFVVYASAAAGQLPLGPLGPNSVVWDVASGGNGHIYEAVAVPGTANLTWSAANAAALAAGGYLATVPTPAENLFVFGLINAPQYWIPGSDHGPWLGGHQEPGSPEPAGGWTWVTG